MQGLDLFNRFKEAIDGDNFVEVDGYDIVIRLNFPEWKDDEDHEVASFFYLDEEELEYEITLTEKSFNEGEICGHELRLNDDKGGPVTLRLYSPSDW